MKTPDKTLNQVKPCPCCGSKELIVGKMSSSSFGVLCTDCGINISRFPQTSDYKFMPKGKAGQGAIQWLRDYTLGEALLAWNRRTGK